MSAYASLVAGFSAWMVRFGRSLAATMSSRDLALVGVATHRSARLVTKDRVDSTLRAPFTTFQGDAGPGEVSEQARGRGLRRAIGELVICPCCLGVWLATGFTMGMAVAPRPTRWIASATSAVFVADALQIAYAKGEDLL